MQKIILLNDLHNTPENDYKRKVLQGLDEIVLISFKKKKVRFNVKKCKLLRSSAAHCGRLISQTGWGSLNYSNKILTANEPNCVHEIAQDIYIMNWLSLLISRVSSFRVLSKQLTTLKITS